MFSLKLLKLRQTNMFDASMTIFSSFSPNKNQSSHSLICSHIYFIPFVMTFYYIDNLGLYTNVQKIKQGKHKKLGNHVNCDFITH